MVVSSASGAVHPLAARAAVQRARVLGVGHQLAAALGAAVLDPGGAGAAPRAVAQRQGRGVSRSGEYCLHGKCAHRFEPYIHKRIVAISVHGTVSERILILICRV